MTHAEQMLLEQFENLHISAPDFHHADHVRVAFIMLNKYDFVDACSRYANTIKSMAHAVGVPDKYNATITFAFMSVIAERKAYLEVENTEDFLTKNPDLLRRDLLSVWYSKDRMTSAMARSQFLLPDKPKGALTVKRETET